MYTEYVLRLYDAYLSEILAYMFNKRTESQNLSRRKREELYLQERLC